MDRRPLKQPTLLGLQTVDQCAFMQISRNLTKSSDLCFRLWEWGSQARSVTHCRLPVSQLVALSAPHLLFMGHKRTAVSQRNTFSAGE